MSCEAGAPRGASVERPGPAALYLLHVWTLIELEIRKLRKDPTELFMRAVQPALWLLVFGQAFSRIGMIPTGGLTYLAFLTPGILSQSVTFIAIFYGISIIWERETGQLQKFLTTPMQRSAMFLGKMFGASVRSIGQAAMVLILALVLGVRILWSPGRVAGALVTVILGAVFFSGMSMVLAALLKTRERMMGIGQVITMPLFFSSNALYPISVMPGWLRVVAAVNPMSYLVDGLRGLLLGTPSHLGLDWAALAGAGAVMLALSTVLFPRRMAA
ncbi:MAG: ABC transporter permease [Kyrpidia sp.]|nr:ABC transporter permease [Kyrpidia sp.]